MRVLRGVIAPLAVLLALASQGRAEPLDDAALLAHSRALVFGSKPELEAALAALTTRGERDLAPAITLALRYNRWHRVALSAAFNALTGAAVEDWEGAMLWQEAHPEVRPHPSFRELKLEVLARLDPEFLRFLGGERSAPENMDIRLEEITWGGVGVDGIPSLDFPETIPAAEADYLDDADLVFGVAISGDVRAYPLRIMGWHEMLNEVIGGVPVALAYCTLCGSGILFETRVEGRETPLVFGSSGLLYRSNKLMFDRETDSLWNQFTGAPVTGPLRGSGIALAIRPVAIASWGDWRARHPDTRVLSLETGYNRDYGSGVVYAEYFASPDLMFPTLVRDESRLARKDYVFGMRVAGAAKAWPLAAFEGGRVINDRIGELPVVLVGDAASRTVRAYERGGRRFRAGDGPGRLEGPDGEPWTLEEERLAGPEGMRLARLPGHVSYWFAWDGYLGVRSELYQAAE